MLVEDISSNQINIQEKEKQQKNGNSPLTDTLTAIDELQLMIDKNSKQDLAELNKILAEILNYPNSEQAKIHSQAMRLGNFDLQKPQGNGKARQDTSSSFLDVNEGTKLCPCCGFIKQQDQIKLCTSFDDIKNMGVSTYLYFSTFKNLSILLVIMLIIYSIYGIITNVIASANLSSAMNGSYSYTIDYLSISLSSKETHDTPTNRMYYYVQCWLGAAFIIVWGLVLVFIKYSEIKNLQNYDDDTISCSDYSIVMQGVPLDVTKEELQKQLNVYYENVIKQTKIPAKWKKPLNIVKINVGKPFYLNQDSLKDEELENITKETAEIKEEFVKWIIQRQSSPKFSLPKEQRESLYAKYAKLNERKIEKYVEIGKKIKTSLKEQSSDELTTVFVTFDSNFGKSLMSYLNETNILSRIRSICGRDLNKFSLQREGKVYKLEIRRAPQPQDIIWTNIGQKNCTTYSRKLFTFSVTVALLGVCFAIVYGLTKAQEDAGDNRQISIAISVTISIVNVLLGQLIRYLTIYERDYTQTNHQTSLAIKSILAQMVNSILIPVITAYYIKKKIYQTSGLVDNIFMLSITTSIVPPILLFFDPYNLFLKFKRWYKSKPSSKLSQTQKQHNILHEGVNFQVGYQYLYLVNMFMFVCFFVSLQPIVVVIALVGYALMYWVQKYCLFNRYKRPVPGTDFVNQAVHQIIFMGPIIYSLGSLTWSNFSPNGIPREAIVPNLVAMGLSVLIYVLPMNTIIIGCFFQDQVQKPTTFDEYRLFLPSEYDRLNPTTQEEGLEDYRKYMERKKEQMKNLSKEKQAEIAQKMMHNAQRGQLNMVQPNPAMGGYPAFQNNFAMMPRPQPMMSFFPTMPAPMYGMGMMPYQQMPVSRPVQPMMQPAVPQFMPQMPMVSQIPMIYNAQQIPQQFPQQNLQQNLQQNPQARPVMAQPMNNPLAMMMNPQMMSNPSSMNLNANAMNYNQNMNPRVQGGYQAPYANRRY